MSSLDVDSVLKNDEISPEDRVTKLLIMERRRRICASRALRIVQQLSTKNITIPFLSVALNLIERSHWDDVINERNGEELCGYVLCCEKPLQSEGKRQKYKICARTNRIYDMEMYNPFCSINCFKKSNVLKEKIPDISLTSRDEFKRIDLDFLEDNENDEDNSTNSSNAKVEKTIETKKSDNVEADAEAAMVSVQSCDTSDIPQTSLEEEKPKKSIDKVSKGEAQYSSKRVSIETAEIDPMIQAKETVKSWSTPSTEKWLNGEDLDLEQTFKQEDVYREKVYAFMGRKTAPKEQKTHKDDKRKDGKSDDEAANIPIQMPLVDAYSQTRIRKRIVLEKLSSYLKQFMLPMSLSLSQVSPGFKSLVNTFSLTAHNIVLRPRAWSIVTLLLLKLLAKRDEEIRLALASHQAKEILSQFLEDDEEEKVSGFTEDDYLSVD